MAEFDTPFHPTYTVYTRANIGEVLPEPVAPLAWSILGPAFEEGFRRSFCDDFRAVERPAEAYCVMGRFAARAHLNLSVIRTVADRVPGTSAQAADHQYFGDAAAGDLPVHPKTVTSPARTAQTIAGTLRTMGTVGRRVARAVEAAKTLDAETTAFLATDPTDVALVDRIAYVSQRHAQFFGLHITNRALTSSRLEMAAKALRRKGFADHEVLELVSAIPELESAKPSRELAAIAATAAAAPAVASAIASGASLDELATVDGGGAVVTDVRRFLDRFGHRGVNEFDPTVPSWGLRPDLVLALVRSLMGEGANRHPSAAPAPSRPLGRVTAKLVADARLAMMRGELSKDAVIRVGHQIRRLIVELEQRWTGRIGPASLRMCTLDEVRAIAAGGGVPTEELARRAADFAEAAAVEPDLWSDGVLRVRARIEASGAASVRGIAGSPGKAVGRIRRCTDPYGEFEDGEVLLARITDTAWTPLFLAAAAVVTEVGGVLSHATIVARELGIPAVVDAAGALAELADGDLVEVDGDAGVVHVRERAAVS